MKYSDLSDEAKDTLVGMVQYCIENEIRMGMDAGIECFDSGKKHNFRAELEAFVAEQSQNKVLSA
ncbi:hypothetical protein [Vibrio parahaemolyticus]|nr:hypothetical protein [Vibrio parahaemolyticus]OCP68260.1 hypothetical protein AKH08_15700 [Vibrio parahaemolyticus]